MTSWKTSAAGLLILLSAVTGHLAGAFSGTETWAQFAENVVPLVFTALAAFMAKDRNVSNSQNPGPAQKLPASKT